MTITVTVLLLLQYCSISVRQFAEFCIRIVCRWRLCLLSLVHARSSEQKSVRWYTRYLMTSRHAQLRHALLTAHIPIGEGMLNGKIGVRTILCTTFEYNATSYCDINDKGVVRHGRRTIGPTHTAPRSQYSTSSRAVDTADTADAAVACSHDQT